MPSAPLPISTIFDDTHLATVVHPAAAVFAACYPAIPLADVSAVELVAAAALGIEAQLRVGLATSPSHYEAGWHIPAPWSHWSGSGRVAIEAGR